jgi:hypothetical protein
MILYMAKVVNVKKVYLKQDGYNDFEDWCNNTNNVYIGRDMSFYVKGAKASKWANPYPSKIYGRQKCLELYEKYILDNKELLSQLHELRGKNLGCWCKPLECHGDILTKLLSLSTTRTNTP